MARQSIWRASVPDWRNPVSFRYRAEWPFLADDDARLSVWDRPGLTLRSHSTSLAALAHSVPIAFFGSICGVRIVPVSNNPRLARHPFDLQRGEEALHRRIIPTIARPVHGTRDAAIGHQPLEHLAGDLAVPVGVMQQRIGLTPAPDRHDEGNLGKGDGILRKRPATAALRGLR